MGLLGQAAGGSDVVTWVGGGGALALVGLLVTAIIRIYRLIPNMVDKPIQMLQDENKRQAQRISALERETAECRWTNDILIRAMQQGGLIVPAEAFLRRRRADDPPDPPLTIPDD